MERALTSGAGGVWASAGLERALKPGGRFQIAEFFSFNPLNRGVPRRGGLGERGRPGAPAPGGRGKIFPSRGGAGTSGPALGPPEFLWDSPRAGGSWRKARPRARFGLKREGAALRRAGLPGGARLFPLQAGGARPRRREGAGGKAWGKGLALKPGEAERGGPDKALQ